MSGSGATASDSEDGRTAGVRARLTSSSEHAIKGRSGIKRVRMNRHDDSQRSGRLVTQPVRPTPCTSSPRANSLYEKQLTAPADRPVRTPAHAVAFTTAATLGGAGSVHRQTGMRVAGTLPGDRNHAGSPPATDCRQNPPPAPPVNHIRCCADHRPAWRRDAGVDIRRAVRSYEPVRLPSSVHHRRMSLDFPARPAVPSPTGGAGISRFPRKVFPYCSGSVTAQGAETPRDVAVLGVAFRLPPRGSIPGPHIPLSTLRPRSYGRRRVTLHHTLPVFTGAEEVQNDTQRTARARGVSPGEPGESHAARC